MPITEKAWTCDIRERGCDISAAVSWVCGVEGIQISACKKCWTTWKARVAADSSLGMRCPRCSKIPPRAAEQALHNYRQTGTEPLQGIIADALDSAMFREGILGDVRKRVLVRLRNEESWLDSPTPQAQVV
jgi:hypothetical protein